MKQIILLILLISCSIIGIAQDCPYYDTYIQKGNKALKAEQFEDAINHYSAAMLHCPKKAQIVRGKILEVFQAIEDLREKAEAAERKANQKTEEAKKERNRAEKALKAVEAQKVETDKALAKADALNSKNEKLINAFYFYDGRLALAIKTINGEEKYGFINKDADVVIDYKYEKAEQFDEKGFAKVKKDIDGSYRKDIVDFIIDLDFGQNNLI
jgi:seryl-tRNA synthetase